MQKIHHFSLNIILFSYIIYRVCYFFNSFITTIEKNGEQFMSIQKSLRLSLVLMASLPLIFLTIFTYNLSYKKYMELATQSTVELAKTYGMGFQAQLNAQVAEVEGLANGTNIQNLVL